MYRVRIESLKYGIEHIDYPTEERARAGEKRLRDSAMVWSEADGIRRHVIYEGLVESVEAAAAGDEEEEEREQTA